MSGLLAQTVGMMRRFRAPAGPSVIGELYQGGYYFGIINDGGVKYKLLMSPANGGAGSGLKMTSSGDSLPAAASTLTNGKGATDAMIAGPQYSYPVIDAVRVARNNLLGGQNDWYIPARDELELIYRNLKPSTTFNKTTARVTTGLGGGGTQGMNSNSYPTGSAYTGDAPVRTSLSLFQSTGVQSIAVNEVWSCSQNTTNMIWCQYMPDGEQYLNLGNTGNVVNHRYIRRIAA